jgi:hypothetical protein
MSTCTRTPCRSSIWTRHRGVTTALADMPRHATRFAHIAHCVCNLCGSSSHRACPMSGAPALTCLRLRYALMRWVLGACDVAASHQCGIVAPPVKLCARRHACLRLRSTARTWQPLRPPARPHDVDPLLLSCHPSAAPQASNPSPSIPHTPSALVEPQPPLHTYVHSAAHLTSLAQAQLYLRSGVLTCLACSSCPLSLIPPLRRRRSALTMPLRCDRSSRQLDRLRDARLFPPGCFPHCVRLTVPTSAIAAAAPCGCVSVGSRPWHVNCLLHVWLPWHIVGVSCQN